MRIIVPGWIKFIWFPFSNLNTYQRWSSSDYSHKFGYEYYCILNARVFCSVIKVTRDWTIFSLIIRGMVSCKAEVHYWSFLFLSYPGGGGCRRGKVGKPSPGEIKYDLSRFMIGQNRTYTRAICVTPQHARTRARVLTHSLSLNFLSLFVIRYRISFTSK